MKIRENLFLYLLFLCVIGVFTYLWNWEYSIKEMDWNNDGKTAITEILSARHIGKSIGWFQNKLCSEYFSLEDGDVIKFTCPEVGSITNKNEIYKIEAKVKFKMVIPRQENNANKSNPTK